MTVEEGTFSGTLPPPQSLSHYEAVLLGSSERVLAVAEREPAHRIRWEV